MAAYLVCSVIAGIFCAMVGLVGFDAGFWMTIAWYVAGCWAGLIASVTLFFLVNTRQGTPMSQWPDGSSLRHPG